MKNMPLNYADLVQFVRHFLRIRHPEWIGADGQSPMCDLYAARSAEVRQPCVKPAATHPRTEKPPRKSAPAPLPHNHPAHLHL